MTCVCIALSVSVSLCKKHDAFSTVLCVCAIKRLNGKTHKSFFLFNEDDLKKRHHVEAAVADRVSDKRCLLYFIHVFVV